MYTFYLFIVSLFGFAAFYAAAMLGVGDLAEQAQSSYGSYSLYGTVSLALAVGAVWLWHWRRLLAMRSKMNEDGHSLVHFHLFLATSMLALGLVVHGRNAIEAALQLAAGGRLLGTLGGSLAAAAVNLALTLGLWIHHRGYLAAESEYAAAATKRSKK